MFSITALRQIRILTSSSFPLHSKPRYLRHLHSKLQIKYTALFNYLFLLSCSTTSSTIISFQIQLVNYPPQYNAMSSRFLQIQNEAAYSSRSSSPRSQSRTSTSSETSSTSSSYSYSEERPRYSMDPSTQPRVEVLRCSRCAKSVETVTTGSSDDASANGMVRFGHNLYYCDRCARMVGYK